MKKIRRTSPRVYLACPITSSGDMLENIRHATTIWRLLVQDGFAPFNPAANDLAVKMAVKPPSYEEWMQYDYQWLMASDALLRIPGKSKGAAREVRLANKLGIPVFYSYDKLLVWAAGPFTTGQGSILKKDTKSSQLKRAVKGRSSNGRSTKGKR